MKLHANQMASAIATILACSLLAACGGGSGGGMVRSTPSASPPASSPPPPSPPPPPPASVEPCPMPISGDCVVKGFHGLTFTEGGMSGGRQSDHRLFVHGGESGGGWVNLEGGEYRFDGGTEIAGTTLVVWSTLVSDVKILRDYTGLGFAGTSELWLLGTVRGDVRNEQFLSVPCWSGLHDCADIPQQRIEGSYMQVADSTLEVGLGRALHVTGTAALAGTLRVTKGDRSYVLPQTPTSISILHADGGVFGTFDRWTSPGLFIQGSLRYDSHDVWFDLTRISLQSAMAGQGFGGITLASAGHVDRALGWAEGFGLAPSTLNAAQARFLQSAGRLLWLDDAQQAARSLNSLAGAEHARLAADAQQRASNVAGQLALQAGTRRGDRSSSHWSRPLVDGRMDGYDQWLGPRTLLGGSVATEASDAGTAHRDDQRASMYLHHRGEHWQGTLVATAGRSSGLLRRRIDLGDGQAHLAASRRRLDLAQIHVELARPLPLAGGHLQPYVALDAGTLHDGGFLEQGDTGLELTSKGGSLHQFGAAFGLRYVRDWRVGTQWIRLLAGLEQSRQLQVSGQWQAAFLAVPDAGFDLRDWGGPRALSAQLSLQGGTFRGWQWALEGMRDSHRVAPLSWQLRLARDF